MHSPQTLSQPSTRQGYSNFIFVPCMQIARNPGRGDARPLGTAGQALITQTSSASSSRPSDYHWETIPANDITAAHILPRRGYANTRPLPPSPSRRAFATRGWHARGDTPTERKSSHRSENEGVAREPHRTARGKMRAGGPANVVKIAEKHTVNAQLTSVEVRARANARHTRRRTNPN